MSGVLAQRGGASSAGLVWVLATFVGVAIVLLLLLSLLGGIGSVELTIILLLALAAAGAVRYATRRSEAANG